jgi:hypothetical protein
MELLFSIYTGIWSFGASYKHQEVPTVHCGSLSLVIGWVETCFTFQCLTFSLDISRISLRQITTVGRHVVVVVALNDYSSDGCHFTVA